MPRKDKLPIDTQELRECNRMAMNTAPHYCNELVEISSCTKNMQDTMLTYSPLPRGDLLGLSLTLYIDSPETTFKKAAAVKVLTIIRDPDFNAHRFSI